MKTLAKSVFMALAAFVATSAFADAKNVCIPFSTVGPDYYADGSMVAVGEWYALCWSEGEVSIKADGFTSQVENGEILLAGPLAKVKDGKAYCPKTFFQLDSAKVKDSGYYSFCVLDTRDVEGKPFAGKGLPPIVNGYLVVGDSLFAKTTTGLGVSSTDNSTDSANFAETEVPEGVGNPEIKAFAINNDSATFTVSNLSPALRYNIISGSDLNDLNSLIKPFTGSEGDLVFVVDAKDAKFFKIIRQPLDKPLTTTTAE